MSKKRKIAIIGLGPRGGFALEQFVLELAQRNNLQNIHIALFEQSGNYGNGQVYDLKQDSSNWININERILELEERPKITTKEVTISSFPSYHKWRNIDFENLSIKAEDSYPPRSTIGQFLAQRFQSLIDPLINAEIARLHKEKVTEVLLLKDGKLKIRTDKNTYEYFDEVLLTIGHQPTKTSKQIKEWKEYVAKNDVPTLFTSPYPTEDYLNHNKLTKNSSIGIRGFGLSMIDIARAIGQKFGKFINLNPETKACSYQLNDESNLQLLPFSLDGSPPVPKPLNAEIDFWFKPRPEELSKFEKHVGNRTIQKEAKSTDFILDAFAPIAARIFFDLPKSKYQKNHNQVDIENLIKQWLKDQNYKHELITPTDQNALKSMREFVGMATGKRPISLDFCIGQVWRHFQPTIYKQLSHSACNDEVIAEVVALDESTKRYSFGPPVESIQQLIALAEANVLNLEVVKDPEINLTKTGWELAVHNKKHIANIIIDSVLDGPKIKDVNSPLITNLLDDELIQVVHDELGVVTDDHAYLISKNEEQTIPIALLGRLAKGSVVGVDAILECFGERPKNWAKKAAGNCVEERAH